MPVPSKCETIGNMAEGRTGWRRLEQRSARAARFFRATSGSTRRRACWSSWARRRSAIAVAWQVYQITHSPLYLGLTGLTLFAPGFFFMLAAGHVADRYDRRSVILTCYSLQALCTLALMHFALHPTGRVWPIFAVLFGVGTGRAFSSPASAAFLPSLVPSNHFVNAVTWGSIVFQIANIAGPAVGGLLFTLRLTGSLAHWNGGAAVYAFTLMTLLAFLVLVGMMRTRPVRMVKNAFNLETMLAGFKYVWQTKLLLGSISLDLFAVFLGGATALLPIFAVDILHAGPRALGLLRAMPALGALMVSLVHDGVARPARCGQADALLRRDLRRGNGGLRPLAHHVGQPAGPGHCGRKRHGQRGHPRQYSATGHAARVARTRQRRQRHLCRRVQ